MSALAMKPLTEKTTSEVPRITFSLADEGIVLYTGKSRTRHTYALDVMDLSMVRHICSDSTITSREALKMCYMLYKYVLRLTTTRTIRRLTTVDRDVVTDSRDAVFLSKDMILYKIATMMCIRMQLTPSHYREISQVFKHVGLKGSDGFLYHLLYLNDDIDQFIEMMGKVQGNFDLSVNTLPDELEEPKVDKEFMKAAKYWAWQVRFVAMSNRMSHEDTIQDFKLRCIQSYYWVRPFYEKLHAINYAKHALQNFAQNWREWYQKPERARIYRTKEGGFDNTVRSFDDKQVIQMHGANEDAIIEKIDSAREWDI